MTQQTDLPRRTVLKGGAAAAMSGVTVMTMAGPARAFPGHTDEGVVISWLDQPPPVPPELEFNLAYPLVWEEIQYLTPNDEFFTVKHNEIPELSPTEWRLGITGLVAHPQALPLADLKARRRRAVTYALECSGNQTVPPFQIGLVGNAHWAGASLREVLRRARPLDQATEVIFRGADAGLSTIRDNTAVFSGGDTGSSRPRLA